MAEEMIARLVLPMPMSLVGVLLTAIEDYCRDRGYGTPSVVTSGEHYRFDQLTVIAQSADRQEEQP